MTKDLNADTTLEETKKTLADNFIQLCGNPDDRAAAESADSALHRLDVLLAEADG
ncbi:ABC transporter ATP-binding protein [Streptomyces sp. WM6378]|uniref:ABC transporter ATP-binding protein n=1 Tax=Streptomyces sp. WM6378 TaxID=1415557 RepID=UPI000AE65DCE|nr:ABC transporter ATP-binding protein [Streptomyces sp. WM6378]